MKKSKASDEIILNYENLKKTIQYHNDLYHTQDQPEISDYEFDQLFLQLLDFEKKYDNLMTEDSPSQKVGGQVISHFEKVPHRKPMLSLANSYNNDDIIAFDERVKKFLRQKEASLTIEYFAELKLDGLSMELIYEKGQLVRALTRGDGLVGEDVTHNIKTIKSVPHKINHQGLLEVRGEILIHKKDFVEMNEFNEEQGLPVFANPRNAAAGTIRQLDSAIAASRPLKFYAYALGDYTELDFVSQVDIEHQLNQLGFPIINRSLTCCSDRLEDILKYYDDINTQRSELPFDIDGIVIKVNQLSLQEDLGLIARSPRWATAVKFQPEQATTLIENIVVQVGRTGALTPVAIMKPVKVGGVTITHATLHNQDEINRKDVRIGDTVVIQRAGDVIPEVVSVIKSKRPSNSEEFLISPICPVCSTQASKEEGEVVLRCRNKNCEAVIIGSLIHFVSRRALNIEKIGDKLIESFVKSKLVLRFSDLFHLNAEKLKTLDRQGEKSIDNILKQIQKAKKTTLARFIYALGIRYVGEQTAKLLADHYLQLDHFLKTTSEELEKIPEIGSKVSKTIMEWLLDEENKNEVYRLVKVGITFEPTKRNLEGPLTGLSFLVTGTLPIKRDEAHQIIENNGGKLLSSVSSKLSYLIAGDDPGSKVDKAQSVGCKIISWDDFLKLISPSE